MDFVTAIKTCFGKYVGFSGRAARSELWWFYLFYFIVLVVANIIDAVIFGAPALLFAIAWLGLLLPLLAVQIRRLHDLDKSGWFWLFILIPLVGPIILLVWYCTRGTLGPNRFGPDPLAGVM